MPCFSSRANIGGTSASRARPCNARSRGDRWRASCRLTEPPIRLRRNFRGYALVDLRGQARVHEDGCLRLTEHIDKAGSDDFALGVDCARTRGGGKIPNGGNASVADSDVARVPGRAGSVDDVSVGDNKVKGRVGGEDNVEKINDINRARRQVAVIGIFLIGFAQRVRPYDVSANDRAKDNPYCQREPLPTGEAARHKGHKLIRIIANPTKAPARAMRRSAIRGFTTSRQRRPRTIR